MSVIPEHLGPYGIPPSYDLFVGECRFCGVASVPKSLSSSGRCGQCCERNAGTATCEECGEQGESLLYSPVDKILRCEKCARDKLDQRRFFEEEDKKESARRKTMNPATFLACLVIVQGAVIAAVPFLLAYFGV